MTTAVDTAIVAAWLVVLGHNAVLAARGLVRSPSPVRAVLGVLLAIGLALAGVSLERAGGGCMRAPAVVTVVGTLAVIAGAVLHVRARRVLGRTWSASTASPAALVDVGPYARVRHPLYAALGLMGAGTVAAHPSVATVAGGLGLLVGLALKTTREERSLAAALGPRWAAYRRRVPLLLPRRRP